MITAQPRAAYPLFGCWVHGTHVLCDKHVGRHFREFETHISGFISFCKDNDFSLHFERATVQIEH